MKTQICIIGAGTAGMAAAYALKDSEYDVVLVEKQSTLGGTAVNAWVDTWIEGIMPPYLITIFRELGISEDKIMGSILPDKFARKGKGGIGLYAPHAKLAAIYERDMVNATNLHFFCGYKLQDVYIKDRRVKSIHIVNVANANDVLEINASFFIDCSGGANLACYNGIIDVDFYQGEDPYERFEESLMPKKYPLGQDRTKILNEPSLFFNVDRDGEQQKVYPPVDAKYRINPTDIFIYDGYNGGHWVNPMTGFNISGWAVLELGEEKVYKMAVEQIAGYWDFICREVPRRIKMKEPIYGFKERDIVQAPTGRYAPMLGIRESRRVVCDYMLKQEDLMQLISSSDLGRNIACGSHDIDFHLYGSLSYSDVRVFNVNCIRPSGIPYDCLIPIRFDNVLVAGKSYGASHIALAARRVNKDMAQLGWAAGNAIKWCLQNVKPNVRDVNVSDLQSENYTSFKESIKYMEEEILLK